MIQGMMDNREMEFCEGVQEENHVCASELALEVPKANHPVVIISRPQNSEVGARITPKVIIQKSAVFAYKDNKRVPWNYDCNVTIPGKEDIISKEDQDEGRHYEQMKAREGPIREEASVGKRKNAVEPELLVNEPIKEEEAREFLKFLKHSEYSIVEQLHQQPARISVLALLLNSEGHRNVLLKVLNETYVADDISVNKLDRLVGNISADNFISFSDDEIPPGGMGSTRALHITARCKGCILPGVLVDNGSALNVLPLSTLNRLPVDSSHMKSCQNVVRVFDGTERKVMGRIDIPLLIGPTIYEVDFLVMDIKPYYSCLLGRPWIHLTGAVLSSLHQKLKLVSEGRLATINAKEDIIASVTNDAPYLETSDNAIECSFYSLKFVNTTFILEGNKIPMSRISKTTKMGLGKYLQGQVEAPVLKDKQDRFGLGYKPDARQKRIEQEKKRERRRARLTGSHDFEDDEDCGLSPDLLKMVERVEKQILPHRESIEIVSLEERKGVKIGSDISAKTRQYLIELLREFKDVFTWSYQDMPGLSTDIVVHCLPIREDCKPVQQKLRRMRPDIMLKIKEEV
ncbi:uncharacterized protein LOC128042606 [Gossypium raimondii]|uniref:uncharacterized protein LOC128042606 n=1 Tax=Gossypium raimondii TaxID=29730 RepID=UPI00227A2EEC|nr:uncharacterized protein LOC128042606 [Gossypium raimondii]